MNNNMTTVKISKNLHSTLKELSEEEHISLQELINKVVKKYKKEKFWNGVNEDFEKLQEDKDLWNQELEERKTWDNTLLDDIGE